ncbi:hypothetical protein COOONC_23097 [Cooperia oncophora]
MKCFHFQKMRTFILILLVVVAAVAYSVRKTDISPDDQLLTRVVRKSQKNSEESSSSQEETETQDRKTNKMDESPMKEGSAAEVKRVKRKAEASCHSEEGQWQHRKR